MYTFYIQLFISGTDIIHYNSLDWFYLYIFFFLQSFPFVCFLLEKSCWQNRGNIRRKRPRRRCCAWRSWSKREKFRSPNGSSLTIKPIQKIRKDRCVYKNKAWLTLQCSLKCCFFLTLLYCSCCMIFLCRWRGVYLHLQRVWMERLALARVVSQINPWPSTMILQSIMSGI